MSIDFFHVSKNYVNCQNKAIYAIIARNANYWHDLRQSKTLTGQTLVWIKSNIEVQED